MELTRRPPPGTIYWKRRGRRLTILISGPRLRRFCSVYLRKSTVFFVTGRTDPTWGKGEGVSGVAKRKLFKTCLEKRGPPFPRLCSGVGFWFLVFRTRTPHRFPPHSQLYVFTVDPAALSGAVLAGENGPRAVTGCLGPALAP